MKIAISNMTTTIVLAGGSLELAPRGTAGGKDRKEISDELARHPKIARFAALGKIYLLTLEEAATRDAAAAALAARKAAPPPAPPTPPEPAKPEAPAPEATHDAFKNTNVVEDPLPPEANPLHDVLPPDPEAKPEEEAKPDLGKDASESESDSKPKAGDKKSYKSRRKK